MLTGLRELKIVLLLEIVTNSIPDMKFPNSKFELVSGTVSSSDIVYACGAESRGSSVIAKGVL
jgi:hypothetical protein